jgi:hypothetical protein
MKTLSQHSRCPGRDSNRPHFEYEYKTLTLRQSVQCVASLNGLCRRLSVSCICCSVIRKHLQTEMRIVGAIPVRGY